MLHSLQGVGSVLQIFLSGFFSIVLQREPKKKMSCQNSVNKHIQKMCFAVFALNIPI